MRRVLFVEGCRDGTVGGSHTCLQRMVANLDRTRFHPTVVFYDEHAIAATLRSEGVEVHVLPNEQPFDVHYLLQRRWPSLAPLALLLRPAQKAYNFFWHFVRPVAVCAWRIRRWQADIVHLNNSLNTNHEWMVAARIARSSVVSHERGISEHLSRTSIRLGRSLDRVICISEATRRPLLRHGFDAGTIRVIYDGIDTTRVYVQREPAQVRKDYGIPADAPLIGVVGNIKRWKGQEVVVRAVGLLKSRWPEIRCLLVGLSADAGYRRQLDALIEKESLRSHVIFAGFQANPWDYLNAMDVVVHSSIEPEPFGMVNLEAMFMGKPVVSTTTGGPAEVFEHGRNGMLVEPGDCEALATQIAALLSDEYTRRMIGDAARATVVSRFQVRDTVREIESVYDSLGRRLESVP